MEQSNDYPCWMDYRNLNKHLHMTLKVLRHVRLFGCVQPWHGDDRSENLGCLRAENRFRYGEHLLIMMNLIASGRCLHIEAFVLWDLLAHVG